MTEQQIPTPAPPPAPTTPAAVVDQAAVQAQVDEAVASLKTQLAEALEQIAETEAIESARYAVYDLTYEKFLPGVFDLKPSKTAAKRLVGHDDFEIRTV